MIFIEKTNLWSQITIVIVYILILNSLPLKYNFKKSGDLFHLLRCFTIITCVQFEIRMLKVGIQLVFNRCRLF